MLGKQAFWTTIASSPIETARRVSGQVIAAYSKEDVDESIVQG